MNLKRLIRALNPFYIPRFMYGFNHIKYITLNHFKGYKWFDLHYWSPRERGYSSGIEQSTQMIIMFGATLFHYRFELFFHWAHKGRSWERIW